MRRWSPDGPAEVMPALPHGWWKGWGGVERLSPLSSATVAADSTSYRFIDPIDLSIRRLLRTGEHLNGRKDGLMSNVARGAFAEFTDQEIDDLYTFLTGTFAGAAKK